MRKFCVGSSILPSGITTRTHTHTLSTPTTKSPSLAKLPSEDDIVAMQWGVSGTLIISKLPIKSPTNRILETDMQQGSGELRS